MDFNFSSYSGNNFQNFFGETSLIRIEEEDKDFLKTLYLNNNPQPVDPFDEKLFELFNKEILNTNEVNKKILFQHNSLDDIQTFQIKFSQNFLIYNHLRDIDLYSNITNYISSDKKESKIHQQKGYQFKNLKKVYLKNYNESKNVNESHDDKFVSKSISLFDNYQTNDHDQFFDQKIKPPRTNSKKFNDNKKCISGFRSSISILTKKCNSGEPKLDLINLKSIIENNNVCLESYYIFIF